MSSISFYFEDVSFDLPQQQSLAEWIQLIISQEGKILKQLNYVFCSDAYLLEINKQYLDHDYYTDIITFDSSDLPGVIEGDIFISIERVRDNAFLLGQSFLGELNRVIAHGVLHLVGYDDSSPETIIRIRFKEDSYLSLLTL